MKEYRVEFLQSELGYNSNSDWYSEIVIAKNEKEAKEIVKCFLSEFEDVEYIFRVRECIYSDEWKLFDWED